MDLSNKVALVTGAGGVIGRAICAALAREGLKVVAADMDLQRAQAMVAQLREAGADALAVAVDVTQKSSVSRMVEDIKQHYASIDVLINNAGVIAVGPLAEFPEEQWDRIMAVNLKGAFLCAQAVVSGMMERRWGRIVNVASVAAKRPAPLQSAYASSKHGMLGLTQVWCQELGAFDITVNSVCPGFVDSVMWSECLGPAFSSRVGVESGEVVGALARTVMPLGRVQQPEDIGAAVAYLCHAGNVTGQSLVVDGGLTMY